MSGSCFSQVIQGGYKPKYSRWLRIWPAALTPARWHKVSFLWWTATGRDEERWSTRYREALLSISQAEEAMIKAVQRRNNSLAHELPLNNHRALAAWTQLEDREYLLPFRRCEAEMDFVVHLLRTMPPRLSSRFYKHRKALQDSNISMPDHIARLKKLRDLRWSIFHGSISARAAQQIHEAYALSDAKRSTRYEQGRMLRAELKDRRDGSQPRDLTNEFKKIDTRVRVANRQISPIPAISSALEEDRLQWAKFGLFMAIFTSLRSQRELRKVLYNDTKVATIQTRLITTTPKSKAFRNKWHLIFRTTLDVWTYEPPEVRSTSLSLQSLVADWIAIMDYKIARRPDLVTEEQIFSGKCLFMSAMSKERRKQSMVRRRREYAKIMKSRRLSHKTE